MPTLSDEYHALEQSYGQVSDDLSNALIDLEQTRGERDDLAKRVSQLETLLEQAQQEGAVYYGRCRACLYFLEAWDRVTHGREDVPVRCIRAYLAPDEAAK